MLVMLAPPAVLLHAFPGCSVLRGEALHGGISANASLWELALPNGERRQVVVRSPRFGSRERLLERTRAEFAVLRLARSLGVAAPEPHHHHETEPELVLEYVPGAPCFERPFGSARLERMAQALAQIHRVAAHDHDLSFLPKRWTSLEQLLQRRPETLDETLGESRIRERLESLWPWGPSNRDALLHGDYWPGNLLWRSSEFVAIIDWEAAQCGDPLSDVAITRLDLLWAFGVDAMHEFTARYAVHCPLDFRTLPHWDLCASLRPMSNLARWASAYAPPPVSRPDVDESSMRERHRWFVEHAFERLNSPY